MKAPRPRGTAIDMIRMTGWTTDFAGYRLPVNDGRIERWLRQFAVTDKDLAARILDCVDFVSRAQMIDIFRTFLSTCEGWDIDERRRKGRWFFVAFSSSAGESGDEMLHLFRSANGLSRKQYNTLFKHKSELLRENPGPNDAVVFIDDFSGTGNQVCTYWPEMQELLPNGPKTYLVLVAAGESAHTRIEAETELDLISGIWLTERDNIFSDRCLHFTQAEKNIILKYCRIANNTTPRGYGDSGFVVIFAHTCPNNTIPILHAYHPHWEGLFRRND
jgi:hypothetical protein